MTQMKQLSSMQWEGGREKQAQKTQRVEERSKRIERAMKAQTSRVNKTALSEIACQHAERMLREFKQVAKRMEMKRTRLPQKRQSKTAPTCLSSHPVSKDIFLPITHNTTTIRLFFTSSFIRLVFCLRTLQQYISYLLIFLSFYIFIIIIIIYYIPSLLLLFIRFFNYSLLFTFIGGMVTLIELR